MGNLLGRLISQYKQRLANQFKQNFDDGWGHLYRVLKGTADKREALLPIERPTPEERKASADFEIVVDRSPSTAAFILVNEALRKSFTKVLSKVEDAGPVSANVTPIGGGPSVGSSASSIASATMDTSIAVVGERKVPYAKPGQLSLSNVWSYLREPEMVYISTPDLAMVERSPFAYAIREAAAQEGKKAVFEVKPAPVSQDGWYPRKNAAFAEIVVKLGV
ncbi:MAG: hypothetical protein DI551_00540 [Micavibrio aeruginosavorus]|uniref:Uncharacterized protein n=1 Tax=Micavibrio aeruginosavorus TaxID=349221 RepID=A0A2W5N6Y3_9BACT|nr:MAG: hypothetical protein DI551_00540 [Micavibrio aeruginosavorus]